MGGFISKLLGGGAPKASRQSVADTTEDKRKNKKSRTALLETQGGIVGEELEPDQVGGRSTLLGN